MPGEVEGFELAKCPTQSQPSHSPGKPQPTTTDKTIAAQHRKPRKQIKMAMTNSATLIVVDDDEDMGTFIRDAAEHVGFEAQSLTTAKGLIEKTSTEMPGVIVLDIVMPDMDGIELLGELARRKVSSKIIIMSGYNSRYLETAETLAQQRGLNIAGSFTKPAVLDELEALFSAVRDSIAAHNHA